jgi:hypothetical protein
MMSQQDDVLDEQIRVGLARIPVGEVDPARLLSGVKATARKRRRHRTATALAAVAALALLSGALLRPPGHRTFVTVSPSVNPTTPTTSTDYGLAPLTPLVDEPLPSIPSTLLTTRDGHVFTAESTPATLSLALSDPTGSAGSASGDPEAVPAMMWFATGPSENDPAPRSYIAGATRADVARVDLVGAKGTVSVQTIENGAFPQLRFFLIEDPYQIAVPPLPDQLPLVVAFAADGRVLTDSRRINAEENAFLAEVDVRRGVQDKAASVRDAQVSVDERSLILNIFNCGADPQETATFDNAVVRIFATVKLPRSHGDCLDGDTTQRTVGLEQPVAGRLLIDGRTGAPIPLTKAP